MIVIPKEPKRVIVDRRVDWVGGIIFSLGLGLLCFSITQSGLEARGWREPCECLLLRNWLPLTHDFSRENLRRTAHHVDVPSVFAISILILLAFGVLQWYLSRTSFPPLISPSLFKRHNHMVTSVLIITFCTYNATGVSDPLIRSSTRSCREGGGQVLMKWIQGWVYLTSLWYQNLKGESALMNAIHVLTAPIVGAIASFLIPVLAPRVRVPILMCLGAISTRSVPSRLLYSCVVLLGDMC